MAIDLNRDRYLYRIKVVDYYGCMTAINLKDAKSIYGSKAEYVRARFAPDVAMFIDHGDEIVKKLAFYGASTINQIIEQYPECMLNNYSWMLDDNP